MHRNAHMVDLLRPDLSFDEEVRTFSYKQELTEEDFNTIIEKAEQVKKAAEAVRKARFGR